MTLRSSNTISIELEQKLIDSVRDRPCIWDKSNDNYKNSRSKERAWNEIGTILDIDGKRVKDIWTPLRAQFAKFRRRLIFPTGSAGNRRPHFRHEDAMKFLVESFEPNEETFSNLEDNENLMLDSDEMVEYEFRVVNSQNSASTHEVRTPPRSSVTSNSDTPLLPRAKATPQFRSHSKYNGKRKMDDFEKEALRMIGNDVTDDEYEAFGKTLAMKFRKLGEKNRRAFLELQQKVNHAVHEAEIENLE